MTYLFRKYKRLRHTRISLLKNMFRCFACVRGFFVWFVCLFVCVSLCVCVCVCMHECARARARVWVCGCLSERDRETETVWDGDRDRETDRGIQWIKFVLWDILCVCSITISVTWRNSQIKRSVFQSNQRKDLILIIVFWHWESAAHTKSTDSL